MKLITLIRSSGALRSDPKPDKSYELRVACFAAAAVSTALVLAFTR